MTRYLGRNEILNTTNNEFKSAAIFPILLELPRLRGGQINVAGIGPTYTAGNLANCSV